MENKNYIGITVGILALAVILIVNFSNKNPEAQSIAVPEDSWVATTTDSGETLKYPTDLGTKYITPTDWPPVIRVVDEKFSCAEAGQETERAGETKLEEINGHTYCVTRITEGAAGSSYTQYAYARAAGEGTEIMTFSLRFVNCGNYDEPNKMECENEQKSFEIGSTIDEIFTKSASE